MNRIDKKKNRDKIDRINRIDIIDRIFIKAE